MEHRKGLHAKSNVQRLTSVTLHHYNNNHRFQSFSWRKFSLTSAVYLSWTLRTPSLDRFQFRFFTTQIIIGCNNTLWKMVVILNIILQVYLYTIDIYLSINGIYRSMQLNILCIIFQ